MKRPIPIGVTIDSLLPGGAERIAVELAAGLDPARYRARVLVTRCDGELASVLDAAGIEYLVLGRRGRLDRVALRRALRFLDGVQLVHSHKFANNVYSTMLARRLGVPIVVHEHNWSQSAGPVRRTVDRWYLQRRAARYLACGHSVARTLRAGGVSDKLLAVVPNGTAEVQRLPRAQARARLGLPEDAFVVGMLSRLRPEKGVDVLVEAMARLSSDAGLDQQVVACVLGDGPEQAHLMQLAEGLGVGKSIRLLGHRNDARELLGAFDVGVIPSRWEGLPLAALEMMLASVPVVASAVGELPDLLADGRGMTIPSADPASLASSLLRLGEDADARVAMGRAASRHVRAHHMLEVVARQVEEIYDNVLAGTASGKSEDNTGRAAA